MSNENPLLRQGFALPFDAITAADVEPGIRTLLAEAKASLDQIAANPAPPSYANTLQALDLCTERLDIALNVVRHLESVATTPALREAHNAVQPEASAFYASIALHDGLWRRLQTFAATPEAAALSGLPKRHLEKTLDAFRRAGAELNAEGKQRLQAIDVELAQITTKFSENVLDATNEFELLLTEESQLAGLPPSAVAAARQSAESKGKAGYRFTLQAPSYGAVLTYLDNREIREQLYRAYMGRAYQGRDYKGRELATAPHASGHDNGPLILRILALRAEKAKLLGYADFADLVLTDRMAKSGATAENFLRGLEERTRPFFDRENASLQEFHDQQNPAAAGEPLQPWDIGYWAEKQRQKLYEFDEEELRPYFALPKVMEGLFAIASRLFGIQVSEVSGLPVWHGDVKTYQVTDAATGEHLGSFYADWYPRETKRGGAWMDSFLTGLPGQEGWAPHLGLICGNLTPPIGEDPALLTHRDVETIFHEFGHLIHHLLTRVPVRSLAGTSVPWDFVELPSQIMENWTWEREALDLFALHYQTGEPLPDALLAKMRRARTFRAANAQMRQLSFGITDLALHRHFDPSRDGDVVAYSKALLQQFSSAPLPEGHAMICGFTHLFASPVAYAAGYYSYKWAEVLDADAFSRFLQEGIFNPATGRAFRQEILAQGDSQDPEQLYRNFMGRGPDAEALMVRSGLVAAPTH